MGIYSRDYIREDDRAPSILGDTPTVKRIVILTVLVFLAQLFFVERGNPRRGDDGELGFSNQSVVEKWLALDTDKVMSGQVWRLLTSAFLHDRFGLWHILMNMIVLVWFGRSLELHYGSREFLFFYIAAAIFSSIAYVVIQLATGERAPAIGASGAIMAIFCLFAMWNPGYTVNIYFFIPVPIIWLLVIYVLYDLFPLIQQISTPQWRTGVAHAAHLGGVGFGFLYYKRSWNLEKIVDRFLPAAKSNKGKRNVKAAPRVQQEQSRQDQQVDEILAKISREGEASLTERERAILLEASKRYQQRR